MLLRAALWSCMMRSAVRRWAIRLWSATTTSATAWESRSHRLAVLVEFLALFSTFAFTFLAFFPVVTIVVLLVSVREEVMVRIFAIAIRMKSV
jgi:hypothetical protein